MTALRARAVLAIVLAALTTALFWPATGHEFITYDDPIYVTNNPRVVAGITQEGLRWSLTATAGGSWHPLTWWSHMLDAELFGRQPGGHHATSVVLHALGSAALFLVLSGMTGAIWLSCIVAGLFALHPLHVESVAWVSERKDVLATLLWMLTLGTYLRYARRPHGGSYLLVVAVFGLALMSKPMVVTLPLVLLLLDYWPLGRWHGVSRMRQAIRLIGEKLPLLVLSAVIGFVTMAAQRSIGALASIGAVPQSFREALVGMRLMNAVHSCLAYLAKAAWPMDLAVFYPHPAHALARWQSAVAGLTVAAITVLVVAVRRRAPCLAVGWFWYLLTLLPVIGVVQVGAQARADRYTYLPLVGVFVGFAWGCRPLLERRPGSRYVGVALAATGLAAFAAITVRQHGFWQDQTTLFERAALVTSGNYVAYRNLGETRLSRGDYAAAERYFRKELEVSPRSSGAHNRLGLALAGSGRLEDAAAEYEEAVRLNPGNFEAQNNLGAQLTGLGRYADAEAHLQSALQLSPDTAEIHANLGDNLAGQGDLGAAARQYRRALELKPELAQVRRRLERLPGAAAGR